MTATAFQKRPYQIELENKTLNAISAASGNNSVMMCLSTGGGKTVVMGSIASRCANQAGYKVLILAHRDELLTQAQSKFYNQYGLQSGIIKAGVKPNYRHNVQVGSVQSYIGRIGKIPFEPKVIIVDEAHHCAAATYKNILKSHPNAKVIGLTATPYRLDGQGFKDIFQSMVQTITIKQLEEMDFLVPADCYSYPMDKDAILNELAKKSAREHREAKLITKGDYDQNIIGSAMSDYQVLADMVESYRKKANGKTAICFASTVAQSKLIVDYFNSCGIESRHVDAKTENRKQIFDWLGKDLVKMVSNVGIATEGVDIPAIECVMLARKTKSLSLYLQMVGRGSRLYTRRDGTKKELYTLLDFCDNIFEHCLPNADIDWQEHFEGSYVKKKKKKKKDDDKGEQYEMILEDGTMLTGGIDDIPKGMKGISLVRVSDIPEEMEKMPFQDLFLKLSEFAAMKQHKPMSAYVKWQAAVSKSIKKGQKPSINDFVFVANRFGYSEYWAQTQMKNLFQEIQSTHEKNLNLKA